MRVDNARKRARLLRDERKKRNAARAGKTTLAGKHQRSDKSLVEPKGMLDERAETSCHPSGMYQVVEAAAEIMTAS